MELYCPIQSVDLPGIPDILLQGLIVVVGPNSSGKTQLLQDLNEIVCGRRRKLVVASAVSLNSPISFDDYLNLLFEKGTIRQGAPDYILRQGFQYGTDDTGGPGNLHTNSVKGQYEQFAKFTKQKIEGTIPEYPFLRELGALSCSALFLKNRLTLMDPCPTFNSATTAPIKTLQSLYMSKNAKVDLCSEISRVFQRAVWVDNTRNTEIVFRASDSITLPSAEDRLEPEVMEKYRTVETEGDGLRSYCAICATLLLEQRPLCLIDEPEMCLHPPQAHAMGRFIGTYTSDKTCTIVATHSSHVLRGILETKPKVHVIRLSQTGSDFQARKLSPELLEQTISKPRSRSEAILEGFLSHAVVLCEAEGDRIVYESTYRTLKDRRLDIRFTASEGTGGFADPLRLYRALQVPAAVIADIDFLAKDSELRKVLTELGTIENEVNDLCKCARETVKLIRASISHIDPIAIQSDLKSISQNPIDLSKNEDDKLRSTLNQISDRLYRLHDFQERGVDAIPPEVVQGNPPTPLRMEVRNLISRLQKLGLFLVPVGELESWLGVLMKGHSREDKSKWAMLAAEKVEDIGERNDDVWLFIRTVSDFFQKQE